MRTTFPCSHCESTVSFTTKNIEHSAVHSVLCPHCNAVNSNDAINNLANKVGNRFRRKYSGESANLHIIIRNEPVEDVNSTRTPTFPCAECAEDVPLSPTRIMSHVKHTVACPKCSTPNENADVDASGYAMCNSFIIVNTFGKLMPQK